MTDNPEAQKNKPPCTHPVTRRNPPDDVAKKTPENQVHDMRTRLRRARRRAEKLREKLGHVALTKAAAIQGELLGLDANIAGQEAELRVATDELVRGRLRETQVEIICNSCGITVTELDVITSDDAGNPVVKEVKAGANFREDQSIIQIQAIATHFPGGSLHLTAPATAFPEGSVTKGWSVKPKTQAH